MYLCADYYVCTLVCMCACGRPSVCVLPCARVCICLCMRSPVYMCTCVPFRESVWCVCARACDVVCACACACVCVCVNPRRILQESLIASSRLELTSRRIVCQVCSRSFTTLSSFSLSSSPRLSSALRSATTPYH